MRRIQMFMAANTGSVRKKNTKTNLRTVDRQLKNEQLHQYIQNAGDLMPTHNALYYQNDVQSQWSGSGFVPSTGYKVRTKSARQQN